MKVLSGRLRARAWGGEEGAPGAGTQQLFRRAPPAVVGPQCRRVEDAHAAVFGLPRFSLRGKAQRETGKAVGKQRRYLMLSSRMYFREVPVHMCPGNATRSDAECSCGGTHTACKESIRRLRAMLGGNSLPEPAPAE